jgi:hypothetical protein
MRETAAAIAGWAVVTMRRSRRTAVWTVRGGCGAFAGESAAMASVRRRRSGPNGGVRTEAAGTGGGRYLCGDRDRLRLRRPRR